MFWEVRRRYQPARTDIQADEARSPLVGSVGSLVATQLVRCTQHTLRLIVRDRTFLRDLSASNGYSYGVAKDITVERDGVQTRTSGIETELLAATQERPSNLQAAELEDGPDVANKRKLYSPGPISTLFVTTKVAQVVPALQSLLPRLSRDSTIVLLQNGAGLLEELVQGLFYDENLRPNFILSTNTHGSYVKHGNKDAGVHVMWAGPGEIKFALVPNSNARDALESSQQLQLPHLNPLLSSSPQRAPELSDLQLLPQYPSTLSLHTTVSALLACTLLRPSWLPLSQLLVLQKQKVVVNSAINSITAVFDVQTGVVFSKQPAAKIAFRVCQEASNVFAEETRRQMGRSQSKQKIQEGETRVEDQLDEDGAFSPGHPLHTATLFDFVMQMADSTSKNVSTTLQDIRAGKPTTEMSAFFTLCAQ